MHGTMLMIFAFLPLGPRVDGEVDVLGSEFVVQVRTRYVSFRFHGGTGDCPYLQCLLPHRQQKLRQNRRPGTAQDGLVHCTLAAFHF